MNRQIFAALVFTGTFASAAPAQVADSGAFFVRLGNDTIAVERYVRTPFQLKGEAVLRTPQTRRYNLTVTLRDDRQVSWYEVQNLPVPGVPNSVPVMRSVTTVLGDSARVETWLAAVQQTGRTIAASPNMIPLQLPFYSTYETALMKVRGAGDTATIQMLAANGPLPYLVTWIGKDSVTLFHPQGGTIRARVDGRGRILGWSGDQTTFKVHVTRAKWADIDAYARRFAAADSAGRAIGPLSPRDSIADAVVGSTEIAVGYSRPSMRGRRIFGGVVPWGQVWRTGANSATSIAFSDTVVINGVTIPAGKYTMWTIPDQQQWQLIINKQTGQWGTVYDSAQDLVRIPVKSERIPVPVEQFTIDIESGDVESVMTLTWDRTRVTVPIRKP